MALAAEPWPATAALDQAQITTACMIRYAKLADPELLPEGRYPGLESLSQRCEDRPEFQATCPPDLPYPRGLPPGRQHKPTVGRQETSSGTERPQLLEADSIDVCLWHFCDMGR